MDQSILQPPLKPLRMRARFQRLDDQLQLACRRVNPAGCFLILWLTGWTVGCVILAGVVWTKREPFMLIFAIPFWAAWIFVFCQLVYMFFGREELLLNRHGLDFTRRAIIQLKRVHVPLAELKSFDVYSSIVDTESRRREAGLEILTLGQSIQCFAGLDDDEIAWLQHQLNDHLASLRPGAANAPPIRAKPPAAPPTDSRWQRIDGLRELTFERRGRFAPGTVFGLLFITLFWNGIVSVFVGVLCGVAPGKGNPVYGTGAWWGLFVFLIPFEVIGLAMFTVLLGAILEPFHLTRWTFDDNGATLQHRWLSLGRTWHWSILRVARAEVRPAAKQGNRFQPTGQADTKDAYELLLVDPANAEICRVRKLTEGEAHWMAQSIQQTHARWFR